jgi:thioredoxin-related protein
MVQTVLLLAGLALAGLALAGPAPAGRERPAETHFFDASFGDLKEELRLAHAEGKKGLFLMYATEECPPCIWMKKNVMNRTRVQDHFRRHFRVLHIDFNGDTEMADFEGRTMRSKDFAQKVARVRGTPAFAVVGLDGSELLRHYGPTRNADEFLLFADFVASGAHRSKPFDAFRRERLAAGR